MSETWKSQHTLYIHCNGEGSNNLKYYLCQLPQMHQQLLRLFVLILAHCAQNTGGSIHLQILLLPTSKILYILLLHYNRVRLLRLFTLKRAHCAQTREGQYTVLTLLLPTSFNSSCCCIRSTVVQTLYPILMVNHCFRNMEESAYTVHPLQRRRIQQLEILSLSMHQQISQLLRLFVLIVAHCSQKERVNTLLQHYCYQRQKLYISCCCITTEYSTVVKTQRSTRRPWGVTT